ncbi:MAG: hypothetical protein JW976_15730 [Syntrophaceae bacterium]|nr:hypothetical protein [Syntrophaceae bacterium]
MRIRLGRVSLIYIIIIYPILLFIFVNSLQYTQGDFYFSFKNLFNLELGINKYKFDLFISLLMITSIIIALYQWIYNIDLRYKTDINGLLEDIHHNYNLADDIYYKIDKKIFFSKIYKILNEKRGVYVYPNPDTNAIDKNFFADCIVGKPYDYPFTFLHPMRDSFIEHSITSDNIFSLKQKRIFLNLRHLRYSIYRFNHNINNFNLSSDKKRSFYEVREEYYVWVLFRLSFILVDLIVNTPEKYFIDKDYVREIKGYIMGTLNIMEKE